MSRFTVHAPAGGADPSMNVRTRTTGEVVRRVARYLRPYPWLAAGTIACALVSLAGSFAFPQLTQFVIDDVIGGRRADLLPVAALGLLGAFLVRDVFSSIRIRLNNVLEQNVILDIRREVYARLQRLSAGWFDQRASGDLMTRVLEDVNSMERLLIDGTEQGTVAVLSILGVIVVLFASEPTLATAALVPVPLLAAGALWYTLTAHRRYRAQRQASSAMNALLMDNLQGVRQIKAFGRETHEDGRFRERAEALRAGTLGVMKVWAWYQPAMAFSAGLGTVLVLYFGGKQVVAGTLTLGGLVKFLGYLALLYDPVGRLHTLNQMLSNARAAGERVFDILDEPTEESGTDASARASSGPWPRVRGEIVYEDVVVDYGNGRRALDGVSFMAKPGEMIALVGPTGAGKSTLVNLLPRFYRAASGRIYIDGRELADFPLAGLRAQLAVVSQEPFLFNGTIGENILFGRLDASPAEMETAARAANVHDFIARLPDGYATRVGERGVRLSVGEKQRISIARALLKDAPILILDEATASVDTATERLIQEALERLMRGRTSFVIAHRLATIRRAEQILVLRAGRIVERGSHASLLAAGGLYARLHLAQETTAAANAASA